MTTAHLRACPACARHVRVTELACPFCGVALEAAFRGAPAPVPLSVRLSRAALVALGSGTLSLAAACGAATGELLPLSGVDAGEGDTGASESPDAATGGFDAASIAPPYGIAPPPPFDASLPPFDAGEHPPVDASRDGPIIFPPYGAPPYGDGGSR